MDPEDKELLRETAELTRKNNKILKNIQSAMRWGRVFRIVYWIIIIGSMLGAYYFLEPYFRSVLGTYKGIMGGIGKTQQVFGDNF